SLDQRAPFRTGERHTLILTDMMLDDSKAMVAEVVWCREGRVGFRWVDVDEEQRRWLGNHSEGWEADLAIAAEFKSLTTTTLAEALPQPAAPRPVRRVRLSDREDGGHAGPAPIYGPSPRFNGKPRRPDDPGPGVADESVSAPPRDWRTRAVELMPAVLA